MNKEAYLDGFRKTAESLGTNAERLIKFAAGSAGSVSSDILGRLGELFGTAKDYYNSLDPDTKKGIVGGATTGLASLLLSEGDLKERILKGLLYGSAAGLGTYGLSRSGYWDKGVDWIQDNIGKLRTKPRNQLKEWWGR